MATTVLIAVAAGSTVLTGAAVGDLAESGTARTHRVNPSEPRQLNGRSQRVQRHVKRVMALRKEIRERRSMTWHWQGQLGIFKTKTAYRERRTWSIPYLRWVKHRWSRRAHEHWRSWAALSDPQVAICHVFQGYCQQALKVSWCESRHRTDAANGQYLGLFQMGSFARSTYGHSSTALGQARAAFAYFVASGRDWSPWSCRP
jgi:hypothetical protein